MDQYTNRRRINGERVAQLGHTRAARHMSAPWWTPTPRSRALGAVLVGFLLIVVLAVAGALEGPLS